jgi:hypothetical protein
MSHFRGLCGAPYAEVLAFHAIRIDEADNYLVLQLLEH